MVLAAPCLAEVTQIKLLWQGNAALWGGTLVQPTPEDLGSRNTYFSASSKGRGSRALSHHLVLSFQRGLRALAQSSHGAQTHMAARMVWREPPKPGALKSLYFPLWPNVLERSLTHSLMPIS